MIDSGNYSDGWAGPTDVNRQLVEARGSQILGSVGWFDTAPKNVQYVIGVCTGRVRRIIDERLSATDFIAPRLDLASAIERPLVDPNLGSRYGRQARARRVVELQSQIAITTLGGNFPKAHNRRLYLASNQTQSDGQADNSHE